MGCLTLFLWKKHIGLIQWHWLQVLASSQCTLQRFFIKFYSFFAFSLTTVVHKCVSCQKVMTWLRCDCEVRDDFLLQKSGNETRSDLWVEYLIAILYIPFEKYIYVDWKFSFKHTKKKFSSILNPILKFLYQNGKYDCIFFTLQGLSFASVLKCIKLFLMTLS